MIAQAIVDAQTKLAADLSLLTSKVNALVEAQAGSATPAEQATIADGLNAIAAQVEALSASIPTV